MYVVRVRTFIIETSVFVCCRNYYYRFVHDIIYLWLYYNICHCINLVTIMERIWSKYTRNVNKRAYIMLCIHLKRPCIIRDYFVRRVRTRILDWTSRVIFAINRIFDFDGLWRTPRAPRVTTPSSAVRDETSTVQLRFDFTRFEPFLKPVRNASDTDAIRRHIVRVFWHLAV